jgi:hypothetical protein
MVFVRMVFVSPPGSGGAACANVVSNVDYFK